MSDTLEPCPHTYRWPDADCPGLSYCITCRAVLGTPEGRCTIDRGEQEEAFGQ
jgi:hypothetical protein